MILRKASLLLSCIAMTFCHVASGDVIDQIGSTTPFVTNDIGPGRSFYSMTDNFVGGLGFIARSYDDFTLTSGGTVTNVRFIGAYDGDDTTEDGDGNNLGLTNPGSITPPPVFTVTFWEASGDPNVPGAQVAGFSSFTSSNASAEVGQVAITSPEADDYFFEYNIPVNLDLALNTQYWVSVEAEMDFDQNGWGLAFTDPSNGVNNQSFAQFDDGSGVAPLQFNADFAIGLTSVPEPTSGLALLFASAGVAFIRRRS
ncbi:MAG: PEP-CTERM sorting domain-containing protein [Aureliella sp.]